MNSIDKEEFEYILLEWAFNFRKKALIGNLDDGVRIMLGDSKEEFEQRYSEFIESRTVEEYFSRLKRFGKRPHTKDEIIHYFNGTISERAVERHLANLQRWKKVKATDLKVGKQSIRVYSPI